MQQYQFEKIYSQMQKEFGRIKPRQEDDHSFMLMPLETNALKINRKYPSSNSRRLKEATALVLFDIKERCTGEKYDLSSFRNEDNQRLEQALLMAFDPFTNEEVMASLKSTASIDLENTDDLHNFYQEPVICILRIKESIDTWEKNLGANGYFEFIEKFMGNKITDDKMNFSFAVPGENLS